LIPGAIIDQHFRERDRFGRLLAAVLCNPSMLGFGLDENTAFELDASDRLRVMGSGTLTIVDASDLEATNVDEVPDEAPAAFAGMRLHVLSQGWSFELADRRVERPPANAADDEPDVDPIPAPPAGEVHG
jgi:cyanophycinase